MALLLKRNVPCRLFRRLTLGGILTPLGFVLASAFGKGSDRIEIRYFACPLAFSSCSNSLSTSEFAAGLTELRVHPKVSASLVPQEACIISQSNRSRSEALIERYFKLAENQTTVRRELLGGLSTFMTMAYIIVVNPQILAQAGMPADGVLFATCISAAAASLVMGLYANYPIALAPGMSLNAYFTYSVCLGMHIPWQTALGVVFFSGVLFILLTVTRVREQIVNGIPDC